MLEPIFQRQPDHPGVAHYLIHLYDYPPIADEGLDAARRYAKIAPAARACPAHAIAYLHASSAFGTSRSTPNAESARVAKEDGRTSDQLHAMDYLVYANLQFGQDRKAKAVIDEMTVITGRRRLHFPARYALAASPARYAIERGDWKEAAALLVRAGAQPHVQAISHWARARRCGAPWQPGERQGRYRQAGRNSGTNCREAKDAYWAEQVDIQIKVASAWVLYAEGKLRRRAEGDERRGGCRGSVRRSIR